MTRIELEQLINRLGKDSHGVVTAKTLRLHGVPGAEIADLVGNFLHRPVKGIYLPRPLPLSEKEKAHIAVAHAGPGAVLTGLMGARWRRLRWVPSSLEVHVLVHPERRRRGTECFVRVRRCAWVDQIVTTQINGVPVAPVAQLVVDGARELKELQDVRGLTLGAIADERCKLGDVRAILDKSASAGTALVRQACRDAERGAASPPEAEYVDAMLGRGIPFYVNAEIYVDGVLLGVADIWLVGTGTGQELDSKEWHQEEGKLDATLGRHGRFGRAGLSLCHASPTRFRAGPEAVIAELLQEVARRRALGLVEPPGLVVVPRGPLLC